MKDHQEDQNKQKKPVQLSSIKITNFKGDFEPVILKQQRYTAQQHFTRRRGMVHTSLSKNRNSPDLKSKGRQIHTSQEPRLYQFLQDELIHLHQRRDKMAYFSQLAQDKISQLKSIMQLKSISLKKSSIKEEKIFHFTQYKLQKDYKQIHQQLSALHSRNMKNSPFAKTVKARRLISRSLQIRNPSHLARQNEFKSIELDTESKYGNIKKMVLLGGAIRSQIGHSPNPQNCRQLDEKIANTTSRSNYNRHLRHIKQNKPPRDLEQSEDDCKPWETHRNDHLEEM